MHEPHSFNTGWLRATPGEGLLGHRYDNTSALLVKSGRWAVRLNAGGEEETVVLGPQDALSRASGQLAGVQPAGGRTRRGHRGHRRAARRQRGDGRVRLEWAPEVVDAAFEAGWMLDPNGYLAPVGVMVTATEDD